MTRRLPCRIAFLAALALLAGISLAPEGLLRIDLGGYDKQAHLAAYFVLAMFAALGWPAWRAAALIGLPLAGLALEAGQSATGRDFDWGDALANAAGIGLAVALSAALTRRLDRE